MKIRILFSSLFIALVTLMLAACRADNSEMAFKENNFPLQQSWKFIADNKINSLAVSNKRIALGTLDGITVVSLDSGQLLWASDFLIDPESPLIMTDDYLLASNNTQIKVFSNNGNNLTTIEFDQNKKNARVISSHENFVFVLRTPSWLLEVYNLNNGSLVWKLPVGPGGIEINFDPLTKIVYITSVEFIKAIEINSGKLLWEYPQNVRISTYNPSIIYYVAEADNPEVVTLVAYDVINKKNVWVNTFHPEIQTIVHSLSLFDNNLLLTTDFGIVSFDKNTGHQLWASEEEEFDSCETSRNRWNTLQQKQKFKNYLRSIF